MRQGEGRECERVTAAEEDESKPRGEREGSFQELKRCSEQLAMARQHWWERRMKGWLMPS
jgi:hypothetical protein